MAEETGKPTDEMPVAQRVAREGTPLKAALLPELSKETWDYLELKLWNSFSKKIWVLVTAVVTILGLLATLGLNAWLQSKVDTALTGEKDRFNKAVSDYQLKSEATLTIAAIAFHVRQREARDIELYISMVNEIKGRFPDDKIKSVLASKEIAGLLWPLERSGNFVAVPKEEVTKVIQTIGRGMQPAEIRKLEDALVQLALASRHILALREMSKATEKLLFTQAQVDPARLVRLYEEQVLPTYVASLKKSGEFSLWWNSDSRQISSLFPSGQSEFNFYIPNYMDKVFDRDEVKK